MKKIIKGVYFLFDGDELVYIGQSGNVYARIGQHIREGHKEFDSWEVYETEDYIRLEPLLIGLLRPKYNQTNGTTIIGMSKDYHSKLIENDRLSNLIEAVETRVIAAYGIPLKKVCDEISGYDLGHTKRMLIKHYSEIPLSRIDGQWYLDSKWYEENKEKLKTMIDEWDNEMWAVANNSFAKLKALYEGT